MATFSNLLERMRREVIGEDARSGGGWEDDDLLEMMFQSSSEIAGQLGFPTILKADFSVATNATSFAAPTAIVRAKSLMLGSNRLRETDVNEVLKMRGYTGIPRVFSFDPRRGDLIDFAPKADTAYPVGTCVLEYVQRIDPDALTQTDEPWAGKYREYHWIVPLHAGVKAWEMVDDSERSIYFFQRFSQGFQGLAAILNQTTLGELMIPPQARNDEGGRQ